MHTREGDTVHYTQTDGTCQQATVIRANDGVALLSTSTHQPIAYAAPGNGPDHHRPGTWHPTH